MNTQPLFYPVKKIPIRETGMRPEYLPNRNINQAIVVEQPEGYRVVNFCSEDYEIQTNASIVEPLLEAFALQGLKVDLSFKVRDHAKFYIDFISRDFIKAVATEDNVSPRLRVQNSYDGSLKYQGGFGLWRQVCSNGLTVPVAGTSFATEKFMHTAQVLDNMLVTETIEKFQQFCEATEEFLIPFRQLAEKPVYGVEDFIQDIVDETNYPKRMAEAALATLQNELEYFNLKVANEWLVYNALNFQLNHGETRAKEHKKDKVDLEVLEYMLYS